MSKKISIALISISILLMISLTVAFSYAYWSTIKVQDGINVVQSGCFSMSLTNEANAINLDNAYPISDEQGSSTPPYTFTVTNTCSIIASYSINLEMLEGTDLNSNFVATKINDEEKHVLGTLTTAEKQEDSSVEARRITTGVLGPGETETYSLRVWMDKSVKLEDNAQNKTFKAKVVIVGKTIDMDKTFAISGYLVNDENEKLSNAYLAVYSDTLHVVKSDLYGYVYIEGLEKSMHEIYYLNTLDPTGMTKEEVQNSAVANVDVGTNYKGEEIVFSNNYKITNLSIKNLSVESYPTYNITLNADNGETPTTKEVTQNGFYGELPEPTKAGYNFNGWFYGERVINSSIRVTESSTHELLAHWDPKKYTVTFNANGGALSSEEEITKEVTYNTMYGTLPTPSRDNYTFGGWYTESGTQITSASLYTTADNIELTAKWNPVTYTITYNLDGGTVATANPGTCDIETETFDLTNPTKAGYTFLGWTGSNGETPEETITITYGSSGNKTYTAKWRSNGPLYAFGDPSEIGVSDYSLISENVFVKQDYGKLSVCFKDGYNVVCYDAPKDDGNVPGLDGKGYFNTYNECYNKTGDGDMWEYMIVGTGCENTKFMCEVVNDNQYYSYYAWCYDKKNRKSCTVSYYDEIHCN